MSRPRFQENGSRPGPLGLYYARPDARPGATHSQEERKMRTAKVLFLTSAAAEYYPASYWYSLLKVPDKSEFPGTGPQGNGISPNVKSQAEFLERVKTDSCWSCHQLGTKATREIPKALGNFDSPAAAWERR